MKETVWRILWVLTLLGALTSAAMAEWVSGRVYNDKNGNGKRDAFEKAEEGRLVFLYRTDKEGNFGMRTDARGNFTLKSVPAGRYRLRIESMGEKITQPESGGYDIVVPATKGRTYVFGAHDAPISVGKLDSVVEPTCDEGCYDWDFTFTNTSNESITEIYFDVSAPMVVNPRDVKGSDNHYTFPNPVKPGKTVTIKLTVCGAKPGECVKIPLLIITKEGACCLSTVEEICFPEDQCMALAEDKIKCAKKGTYTWNLSVTNLTGSVVTKVALSSIRNSVGTILGTPNPSLLSGLSIANNQTYNLPTISIPAIPGGTVVTIEVILYNKKGECCRKTFEARLPICEVDGECMLCKEPLDLIASKPTFAEAKKPKENAAGVLPARLWSNYKGTVAARTFSEVMAGNPAPSDLYALSFINMGTATLTTPILGQYDISSTFSAQFHGPPDPQDTTGNSDLWKHKYIGTVFGLTMDNKGNTYVAHFGMYPNNVQTGKNPNTNVPWKWGSILRIDNMTGEISKFAELPNDPVTAPGLGNITYDYDHKLIFAVNMEDGLIYRMTMAGNTSGSWPAGSYFGPFSKEKPGARIDGYAPSAVRIFAIQYHCGKLYFSRFADTKYLGHDLNNPEENLIYSIQLDKEGNFVPGVPKYEAGLLTPTSSASIHLNPVSDISFSPEGRMGVSEMTLEYVANPVGTPKQYYREGAHESGAWEYDCDGKSVWVASDRFHVGPWSRDTAGGLDYDYNTQSAGSSYMGGAWYTGTNLNPSFYPGNVSAVNPINAQLAAYGAVGFDRRPGFGGHSYFGPRTFTDLTYTTPLPGDSIIIDYNGGGDPGWFSKRRFGDFEIPMNR